MKRFISFFISAVLIAAVFVDAEAQQVRLRSQITPACGSGIQKFADIYADGNIAVMGSFSCRGVFIFDVSNPDSPSMVSHYNPTPNQQFLEAIVIGNRGYFGSGSSVSGEGVHIVDLTVPSNPVLLGKVNATNVGFNQIHEMIVFDHGGATYLLENANITSTRNVKIINVSDPAAPVLKWDFQSSDGGWVHAMHIRGNRMYLSGFFGSSRIDIYDISNIATQAPAFLGSVAIGNDRNHSAWTNETGEYLYSARELLNGDLRVYDVRNPAQPLLVKTLLAADLNLNAISPHNPVVMGNKLYVSWYQAGVQVFDITDPTDPVHIGQYDTYQPEFAPSDRELELLRNSDPWDIICGAENLQSALPTTFGGDWAVFPFLGENKVLAGDLGAGLLILDVTGLNAAPKNVVSDFDGDRKTDLSTYSATAGGWYFESSSTGSQNTISWGLPGDINVAADYDGDGRSDHAVWRPTDGRWYILNSSGGIVVQEWGLADDVPVAGDYDADGRADIAVWRRSNGTWYVRQSTLGVRIQAWGLNGDKVAAGDYEGDGKSDMAVWRPSNGTWYVLQSSSSLPIIVEWGLTDDKPLVTDFDGNGRAEFTVFRPSNSTWYRLDIFSGTIATQVFGLGGDTPVPADYDGDGKTDIAVFRGGENNWYRIDSSDSVFRTRHLGSNGDVPSPGSIHPK